MRAALLLVVASRLPGSSSSSAVCDAGTVSWTKHSVSTMDGAKGLMTIDVDGDGDMDMVVSAYNEDKDAWFENDGSHVAFTEHVLQNGALDGTWCVYAAREAGW